MTGSEIVTLLITATTLAAVSVAGTLYATGGGSFVSGSERVSVASTQRYQRYDLQDAYLTCKERIAHSLPYKVSNLWLNYHSSSYDADLNENHLFIDLDVQEHVVAREPYSGQVVCRTSASSNNIIGFKLIKS